MLTRCSRPVERSLTFPTIKACELSTREHRPHDVIAVHVHATRSKSLPRCFGIVERHFIDFSKRCGRRIRSWDEPNERAGHAEGRTPNCAINRAGSHAVEGRINALVLGWINRLVGLDVGVSLSVAVGVENEWCPPLRFCFVFGFQVDLRVEPALDHATTGEPQGVVIVQVQVMCAEAGIDRRYLFRLWIVELNLSSALIDRKDLRRRVVGSLTAKCLRLILPNARCDPDAALTIHREAVGVRLTGPNGLVAPVR